MKYFEQFKIKPRTTKFATDAIAFISNKKYSDTLIALNDVVSFLKGKSNPRLNGLVFDNPNSSTVRYLTSISGVNEVPRNDVYSFNSNEEVVKFIGTPEYLKHKEKRFPKFPKHCYLFHAS